MNMKKPEIKVMRFVNEDVIATSGATPPETPLDFVLSGFFDGRAGNLTTKVNGIEIDGASELNAAFKRNWGGGDYTSISLTYPDYEGDATASAYELSGFQKGSMFDKNNMSDYARANGSYKYSHSDGKKIFFTQITQ
ncbi:MAG: hypothetical protein IKI12_06525 [Lachnospiraceae bacterium]|nr:hypothetical protein [Lachnospiraceae bacterium]